MRNYLSFACLGKIFSPFPFLKDARYSILLHGMVYLVGNFFSFSTLHISSHSLLAYKVSVEKSPYSPMVVSVFVMNHFSLTAFGRIDFDVPWCNFLQVSYALCLRLVEIL